MRTIQTILEVPEKCTEGDGASAKSCWLLASNIIEPSKTIRHYCRLFLVQVDEPTVCPPAICSCATMVDKEQNYTSQG